jgi:hypothetical protein
MFGIVSLAFGEPDVFCAVISPASIQDVLISRAELQERAGHTGTYCPVT